MSRNRSSDGPGLRVHAWRVFIVTAPLAAIGAGLSSLYGWAWASLGVGALVWLDLTLSEYYARHSNTVPPAKARSPYGTDQ